MGKNTLGRVAKNKSAKARIGLLDLHLKGESGTNPTRRS